MIYLFILTIAVFFLGFIFSSTLERAYKNKDFRKKLFKTLLKITVYFALGALVISTVVFLF